MRQARACVVGLVAIRWRGVGLFCSCRGLFAGVSPCVGECLACGGHGWFKAEDFDVLRVVAVGFDSDGDRQVFDSGEGVVLWITDEQAEGRCAHRCVSWNCWYLSTCRVRDLHILLSWHIIYYVNENNY